MNEQKREDESVTEFTMRRVRNAIIEECAAVVGEMRMAGAGIFDERHSGQRGQDRSDALFDAYTAIRALRDAS